MKLCVIAIIIVILSLTGIAESAETLPVYSLSVSFDISNNLLRGVAHITFTADGEMDISVEQLHLISVKFNNQNLGEDVKDGILRIRGQGILEIIYEGSFKREDEETEIEDLENVGAVPTNIISGKGIALTTNWYPSFEGMAIWHLQTLIPKRFKAISEADEVDITDTDQGTEYSFHFPHPLRQIHLVAGSYTERHESYQGTEIYGYFFPEDTFAVSRYLEYTKKYLSFYGKLLGPYPYKRFSIVENILPTGYSMPTVTLLGKTVVKLPFVQEASLGHEILHQWFGNCAYGDNKSGNWFEAIISYLSDNLYKEQEGEGWQDRKKMLIDYQSYVTPSKETPLKDFKERSDFASAAIGYGKGIMVFHMLKNHVGDDTFFTALRGLIDEKKCSETSWKDVERLFEEASGENLDWFFSQWLERKDIPSLYVKDAKVIVLSGVPTVSFEILQKGQPYKLSLPVKVITEKGEVRKTIQIDKVKQVFEIPVDDNALRIVFDEDYDLMRELSEKELPPILSRLLGDEQGLLIFPENAEKYSELTAVFSKEGFVAKEEQEVKDEDIRESSLLILGSENPVLKRLFGKVSRPETGFFLVVKQNPLNTKKVVAYADGDSKEEIDPVPQKLLRYGKYSSLLFKGGENIEKETERTDRGVGVSLYEPVFGINPKKQIRLTEIIDTIIDKPIIFVGERHTNYEDHKVELDVIMRLFQSEKKLAIGMEMFQRPFQKDLDDYLSGAINEREFLKASEYFKRWKFEYNLYREIIEFAKAKGIPVVALNLQEEIVKKVAGGGLDALTEEERREIPQDMDMADEVYRERLKKVFQLHERSTMKNFEYFYQSQILWDETMAHSIAQFLSDHPDYQMVVLAGEQHIIFSSGIPKRTVRLTGRDYATLINGTPEIIDADVGDFVLFPDPLPAPVSPKLGVLLQEDEERIRVKDIFPGSAAAKAGIEKDDAFVSVDNWKIESIEDIKIALFDKKVGETVPIKVLRKRFLRRDKELEFHVTL